MATTHQPVLPAEVLAGLALRADYQVVDCTVGAGGHAANILAQTGPSGKLLGLDVDPDALATAQANLASFGERVILHQANFEQLELLVNRLAFGPVHAILADLGVSSMQLDRPERGFSFQEDGPLDMRMGPQATHSAAELINTLAETELADLIYRYGEERRSRRIARAIVQARPLDSTTKLAEIISRAVGGRRGRKTHPATQTFQAIRIAVNDELGALERFLPQAIRLLPPGGRLAVISFHSLEDRIVKQFFQQEARDCICPPEQLICTCDHRATIEIITKKPIVASAEERSLNPRARSAKLRVVQIKAHT